MGFYSPAFWDFLGQPGVITPFGLNGPGATVGNLGTEASNTWLAANRALLIPFRLSRPVVVTQMWVVTGATADGNVDLGIYNASMTRLVSGGGVAQGDINVKQTINITDTTLQRGQYFIGVALSTNTGTFFHVSLTSAVFWRIMGMFQMANAYPLPATFVPAAIASTRWPLCGITTRAVI